MSAFEKSVKERECVVNTKNKPDLENNVNEGLTNDVEEDYLLYEEYLDMNELYEVPLFDGKAHMTARTGLTSKRFDIWAEVSAVCGTGALVSASGTRDYLWLGLVGDRAVLRWDAGGGPSVLRSGKVKLDGQSKISARRYKKDAMLRVGAATTRGSGPGRMSSLDVDPYIYIGHSPENITKLTGVSPHGFVGCIHRLRVSGHDVIPPTRGLSIKGHGLRPCTPHNLARVVCP